MVRIKWLSIISLQISDKTMLIIAWKVGNTAFRLTNWWLKVKPNSLVQKDREFHQIGKYSVYTAIQMFNYLEYYLHNLSNVLFKLHLRMQKPGVALPYSRIRRSPRALSCQGRQNIWFLIFYYFFVHNKI